MAWKYRFKKSISDTIDYQYILSDFIHMSLSILAILNI